MQHYMLLHRAIVYTGITRERKLVVLVGAVKALSMAVKRIDTLKKITALKERLRRFEQTVSLCRFEYRIICPSLCSALHFLT